ncbi:MAG: DEAD/DEAH box helicase, partial [archaeon GB-1867-035]|nr:DEAD/DEAH box helicase [Candidatus Culexmicrobium profundum]
MEKTSSNIFELLDTRLLKVIREFGYITPTKTQEKAIPPILEGKNVLLIAPTGSGKTEAAFFPILSKLINMEKTKGIQAIYITPLRALNRDVLRRMVNIADKLNIRIEVRHGDTPTTQRRKQAIKPPHILITTPETLQAILPGKIMKKHLSNVQWVIIDEIHDLAVDKRGTQLALALERLIEICGKEFQRIGLSATIGSPNKVASFLGGNKRKVTIINVTAIKNFEIKVDIAKETSDDESIAEKLEITSSMAAK